ncbi:glycosyltransferase family 4 protein [Thermodesulforhabdus norvegica]|uniref:Glycosyltransferase involved in cell wall bisynthesis n=1 Tax=Thermodesulforhabdus norvegica TaxID=39841 RepID=A0A1I4VRG3_9BACT|nr:glycosyltransferase family 4 protein [Thermodesulforhabdus norvegica]SFN03629.1 Glycosyltransferase involved in cell wall bisynthesis [Thermodesulforhabdus norvegica]
MRVVLVRRYCGFGYGGAERYFATVAGRLIRRGMDVVFVGERCDPLPGLKHLRIRMPFRGSIARNLAFFYMVPLKIRAEKLNDAIIYTGARIKEFHVFCTNDPLHKPWLYFRYGNPEAALLSLLPRHQTILYLEKRMFTAKNAHFALPSALLKRQLETFYGFSIMPDKVHVIHPGVDFYEFHPPENDRRADQAVRNILFVGNNSYNKGVNRLLSALDLISSRPFTCTLVGIKPGDLKIPFRLRDRVKIAGYVRKPGDLYRRAHVVVIPSLYETFSNVCLESMASGTPVIISSQAGACEIVEHGYEGLHLYEPSNEAELAVRILEILEMDSKTWKTMSLAAAEKAKKFSLDAHVRKLIALFEEIFVR